LRSIDVKRLLIATTNRTAYPDIVSENDGIIAALARAGLAASTADWHDSRVDWSAADAVIIRTTWDYPEYFVEFASWLDVLERSIVTVINPVSIARWNLDKSYLFGLADAGAPIVEVRPVTVGSVVEATVRDLVIKPLRGVGSTGAKLVRLGESETVVVPSLVSPFQPRIAEGELSVFVVDGRCTFSVRKTPSATDWRVQPQWGGRYEVESQLPKAASVAAERTFHAITKTVVGAEQLRYLRIDLVADSRDQWNVLEVEAVEPSFYCSITTEIADSVAASIAAMLSESS
jgi:glutathione synthase/RimK-type ligase-like ATP-grasp enzyme